MTSNFAVSTAPEKKEKKRWFYGILTFIKTKFLTQIEFDASDFIYFYSAQDNRNPRKETNFFKLFVVKSLLVITELVIFYGYK